MNKEIMKELADIRFENMEPKLQYSIDCFQNLLLILLTGMGVDSCIFAGTWPWIFYKERATDEIRYRYFVSKEAISERTDYELIESRLGINILDSLIAHVHRGPLIINVDQYHVKHHYPDIYHKVHGPHSLILLSYEKERREFYALGVMPEFKGWITESEVEIGVQAFPEYNTGYFMCCWLRKKHKMANCENEDITRYFLRSMQEYETYNGWDILVLSDIYKYLLDIWQHDRERMVEICRKRWMWEIDRLGKALIFYLSSDRYSPTESGIDKTAVIEMAENINKSLTLSFRKISKGWISKNYSYVEKGLDDFHRICSQTEDLKILIREAILLC